jgi:bisphosphoglycerate-dependent phosphoglycerate mutase
MDSKQTGYENGYFSRDLSRSSGRDRLGLTGQHTGFTDLPLTERGEQHAKRLGARLTGLAYVKVLTSPLQRAARTCELAGFRASQKMIAIWSNGTMAITKACAPWIFTRSDPTGNRFGTVALMENHRIR